MPVMDGEEAIKHIRSNGFDTPIVAMTAATMKGVRAQLISQGFTRVIEKPINPESLLVVLDNYLALSAAEDMVPIDDAQLTPVPTDAPSKQHILLVEDDKDAADITALLLTSLGADVHVAHSGKECLNVFSQRSDWSKVLMDLNLPDANGLSLATELRKTAPQLDVVLLSGEEPDTVKLAEANIKQFILKPNNKQVLTDLVKS
jgi:CheY-like chemotaxis protein